MKLHNLGNKTLNKLAFILENTDKENNQLKASLFILDKITQYNQIELLKRLEAVEGKLL